MPLRGDLAAVKACVTQQTRYRVAEISDGVAASQHSARGDTVGSRHVATDIEDVQPAAWTQHAKGLGSRRRFGRVVQVVQYHRGQHAVELAVAEGQNLGVTAFEADRAQPGRLSVGAYECLRIRVEADQVRSRM